MDLRLMGWLAAHRSHALNSAALTLMSGSSAKVLGISAIVLFMIGIALGQVGAVWVTIAAGGTADALATALKSFVGRPRPPADLALVSVTGSSMPSTIAALTAGGAVALVLAARWPTPAVRRAGAVVIGLAVVLVGVAMMYLGAHWLTDVLAGWAIGAIIGAAFGTAFARLTGR